MAKETDIRAELSVQLAEASTPGEQLDVIAKIISSFSDLDPDLAKFSDEYISVAKSALSSNDTKVLITQVFWLGHLSGRGMAKLDHADLKEIIRKLNECVKQQNLSVPTQGKQLLKLLAIAMAREGWSRDSNCSIRIGKMAEDIHSNLADKVVESIPAARQSGVEEALISALESARIPKRVQTIRNWISPVAPEYAKQGGRPSK